MARIRLTVCAVILLLVPLAAGAAPLAHREVLEQGAVLLVAERPAIPVVVVRLYVRACFAFDPKDTSGLGSHTAALLIRVSL